MDGLQTQCTELPIGIIQSIFNKQDDIEKDLIELQVLALDIAIKLGLDACELSELAREEMPEVKPSGLRYVNRRESENKGRLVDIFKTLREISSQL